MERLRSGELDEARVRLAAHVGDSGARLALEAGDAPPATLLFAVDVVAGLGPWGEAAAARAALAALRATRPGDGAAGVRWPGPWAETSPHVRTPRAAAAALAAWLREPTPARAAAAARLLQLPVAVSADADGHWTDEAAGLALQLLSPLQWDVAHVAALPSASARTAAEVARAAIRALAHARAAPHRRRELTKAGPGAGADPGSSAADEAAARVLRAVRDGVAPWALGEGDPLLAEPA